MKQLVHDIRVAVNKFSETMWRLNVSELVSVCVCVCALVHIEWRLSCSTFIYLVGGWVDHLFGSQQSNSTARTTENYRLYNIMYLFTYVVQSR